MEEENQHQGIGTKLMLDMIQKSADKGDEELFVEFPAGQKLSKEDLIFLEEQGDEESMMAAKEGEKSSLGFFINLNISECIPISLFKPSEVGRKKFFRLAINLSSFNKN